MSILHRVLICDSMQFMISDILFTRQTCNINMVWWTCYILLLLLLQFNQERKKKKSNCHWISIIMILPCFFCPSQQSFAWPCTLEKGKAKYTRDSEDMQCKGSARLPSRFLRVPQKTTCNLFHTMWNKPERLSPNGEILQ